MEVTMNQLVEWTGKTFRTVKKRLDGLQPVRENGDIKYFDSKQALECLYPVTTTELAKENLLLERARREKAEIEVRELQGKLVPISDLAKTLDKEFAIVRAHFRALPSKLAKPLSMVTDPHEVQARLAEAVDECLSDLTADAKYKLKEEQAGPDNEADLREDSNGLASDSEAEPS
jgi:hypothetical protein